MMKARIYILPRKEVLDPQGKAIENSLKHLGFSSVSEVRQGKLIEVMLNVSDKQKARDLTKDMCEKLLVNMITEDYHFDIVELV